MQASNAFAAKRYCCLSENSHLLLAGACVPCDRLTELDLSVHLRQLLLNIFERYWGFHTACSKGKLAVQQDLLDQNSTQRVAQTFYYAIISTCICSCKRSRLFDIPENPIMKCVQHRLVRCFAERAGERTSHRRMSLLNGSP